MSMSIGIILLIVKLNHVNNDFYGLKMIVFLVSYILDGVEPIPMQVGALIVEEPCSTPKDPNSTICSRT